MADPVRAAHTAAFGLVTAATFAAAAVITTAIAARSASIATDDWCRRWPSSTVTTTTASVGQAGGSCFGGGVR